MADSPTAAGPAMSDEDRLVSLGLEPSAFRLSHPTDFCSVVHPRAQAHEDQGDAGDYLHARVLAGPGRAALWDWIDARGLVVFKGVRTPDENYRGVRGRSSKGRLSQGEYFHHDGCSGPTKPRVVEIRCPHQVVDRRINTAVAPFPDTVVAMFAELPDPVAAQDALAPWCQRLHEPGDLTRAELDVAQGLATRAIRRELSAEDARAYFRRVDARCGAYVEPWEMGESRLMANANPGRTMQHRRAYARPHTGGVPTGHLLKRWPCEELPEAGAPAVAPMT